MRFNLEKHHRRSIRLPEYDYSDAGAYFITICTHQKECLLGEIKDGAMVVNDIGRSVVSVWDQLPGRFPNIQLDEFIVMPNHVHGIIWIVGAGSPRPGSTDQPDNSSKGQGAVTAPLRPGTIGQMVAWFKYQSTKLINQIIQNSPGTPFWQRNYYERIIRCDAELYNVRKYIQENPLKWEMDVENPRKRRGEISSP